jgi:hypothetical protein
MLGVVTVYMIPEMLAAVYVTISVTQHYCVLYQDCVWHCCEYLCGSSLPARSTHFACLCQIYHIAA